MLILLFVFKANLLNYYPLDLLMAALVTVAKQVLAIVMIRTGQVTPAYGHFLTVMPDGITGFNLVDMNQLDRPSHTASLTAF